MKADRYVKTMLLVIAVLLAINCTQELSSKIETPARASKATQFRMEVFTSYGDNGFKPDPTEVAGKLLSEGWVIINAQWNQNQGQLMIFMQK